MLHTHCGQYYNGYYCKSVNRLRVEIISKLKQNELQAVKLQNKINQLQYLAETLSIIFFLWIHLQQEYYLQRPSSHAKTNRLRNKADMQN